MSIPVLDLIVILVYLLGIMAIGILSVRKLKLTGEVYFLAGRTLGWPIVGASLFAANISTIHMVGLAEDGYAKGLVVGNFEWMATFTLILLSLVFVPFYFRSKIATLPQFLERRYSPLARSIMAFMAILAALLIHIGVSLYAGSQVFQAFFGVPIWLSILIISAVTLIYTVVGGLRAVVVTETLQTAILLGGAVLITYLALAELPKHGVESWDDFNMKVDVQHSAESMDQASGILGGADWLMNEPGKLRATAESIRRLEPLATALEAAVGQTTQIEEYRRTRIAVEAVAAMLRTGHRLDAVMALTGSHDLMSALQFDPASVRRYIERRAAESGVTMTPEQVAHEVTRQHIFALAKHGTFAGAADAMLAKLAAPRTETLNLIWSTAKVIKNGEKLPFVADELEKAGHEGLGAIFADPDRWETFADETGRFAAAAADCKAASAKITAVGDMNAYLESTAVIRTPRLSMLRAEGPFFWLAILLGYPILGVWYWCSDQTIVQRVLGARTQVSGQVGALFAGLLKITPTFLMVLPGTIAFVIFRDKIAGNASQTLPIMIVELMPRGLMGLMAAALMAALMSTIAAALNSVGTLVAKDIVGHFRPQTSDAAQVRIGRISAVVLMLVAMLWSTQGGKFGTIFEIINKIPALFLAPSITTVFVWGVFWRRGTKQAAVATLILGLTLGFVLFLIDTKQVAGEEWISSERYGLGIPFMIQAFLMFCIWSVVFVVISLLTPRPLPEQVESTTWPNPLAVIVHGCVTSVTDPRVLAGLLLVVMIVLYYVFR